VNLPGKSDATGKSSSCSVVARRLSIEEGSVGLLIALASKISVTLWCHLNIPTAEIMGRMGVLFIFFERDRA